VEKGSLKCGLHTSVISKKLQKVNNRPMGENSPNLVTLTAGSNVLVSDDVSFSISGSGLQQHQNLQGQFSGLGCSGWTSGETLRKLRIFSSIFRNQKNHCSSFYHGDIPKMIKQTLSRDLLWKKSGIKSFF
jgi:hypothetical protein